MTSKSGTKQQVTLFHMSQHFGICAPVDVIKAIFINEKEAWSGSISSQNSFAIDKPDLFGGPTKQGGAVGTVYFLPGRADQILPDNLAVKLGRANGADCPGYRGLASIFMTGPANGQAGFYWTANDPYLPGVWVTVQRAPIGLDPAYAMVPRSNSQATEFPYTIDTGNTVGNPYDFSIDGATLYQIDGSAFAMWDVASASLISTATLSPATYGEVAIGPDRIYAQTGPFFDPVLGSFDLGGGDYQELVPTSGFGGDFTEGCAWAANKVCFYSPANTAGSVIYDPAAATLTAYPVTFGVTGFCTDNDDPDAGWVVGSDPITSTGLYLAEIASMVEHSISGAFDGTAFVTDNGAGSLFLWQQDHFLLIDKATLLVTATASASGGVSVANNAFRTVRPGSGTIWMGDTEYNTRTLAAIRTIDPNDWVTGEWHLQSTIYAWYNNALITWPAFLSGDLVFRLLDRGAEDANPAHIIYESLANTDWGMGCPSSLIDVTSFEDAGVELFNEPLGLSMIWTRQAAVQDFIQEVLDHIQGALFVDPQTGLLTLKLIRGDYDVGTLPSIGPSTANLSNFGRKLWGDIVNEINVTWTNPTNEQDETVTVHDLASITTQGGIVSDSRNYYGVRYSDLAMRLAARDLRSAGAPLATCDAEVDRSLWFLRPASVLLLDWPEYGLDSVVMRVTSIDYGKPGDPVIKLSLIEDVFGLDAADYVAPPTTSWTDPSALPTPMTEEAVLTLPYYLAKNSIVSIDGAAYPEVLAGVLGASSNADAYGYELWGEVIQTDGSTEWQSLGSLNLVSHAELAADIPAEAASTGVSFSSFVGSMSPVRGGFVLLGSGTEAENELALITSASTTYGLSRGILDTVPHAWAAGTEAWFFANDTLLEDPDARSVAEVVSYRLRTRTSKGLLSLYAAPIISYTLTDRPWLPSRPANVTIGGMQFNDVSTPVNMIGASVVPVTWSNRNRLTEDAAVLAWTDSTVTPETGQTTTITVYKTDGVTVLDTITGLTGTSHDIPIASFGSEVSAIVVLTSSRTDSDGTFESLQGHGIYVQVDLAAPTGMASETDTALALALSVAHTVGRSDETDTAFALGSGGSAGIATETDASLDLAAGPSSPYGSHLAWRLYIDNNNGHASITGFTEFKFYDQSSSQIATSGGTVLTGGSGSGASDNLFDGSTATSWNRTSATGSCFCGYMFSSAQAVASIDLYNGTNMTIAPKVAHLQYSDDTTNGTDGTWTTAFDIWEPSWPASGTATRTWPQDFSGGKVKGLRINISANGGDNFVVISEIEFRESVGGSDQTSGGISFATNDTTPDAAAAAFDNNNSSHYDITTSSTPLPQSIGYYSATPMTPAQYTIFCNSTNARCPTAFKLQGSTDGTWSDLNSQSGQSWSVPETKSYTV